MNAIGKYKLLEQMGVGAGGTTYRALDTFLNRELVVKVLDPALTSSPELREQVCRQLSKAAELSHPHIAKIRDLGEVDGAIYIATELLNGVDLRWHMQRRILPLADKLDLMMQVCGALAFAHSMGIPHGNIKPGNIFVTDKDATVLDFGIGKCLAVAAEAGTEGAALLPNYLAPEQVLGKPFSARSDVFSAAVVLYELLARYPFPGDANVIAREIVHTVSEPLRNLEPQIPEQLEKLIARALEKDPEQRLERMDELAAGLSLAAQRLRGTAAPQDNMPVEIVMDAPASLQAPAPESSATLPPPAFAPMYAAPAAAPPVAPVSTPPAPSAPAEAEVKPVVAAPPNEVPTPPAAPQGGRQVKPVAPVKPRRKRPRWLPYAVAAVLTISIGLVFLARQGVDASQSSVEGNAQAPAAEQQQTTPAPLAQQPVTQPPATQPPVMPAVQAPAPANEPPPTLAAQAAAVAAEAKQDKSSEEQILGEVKSLWTRGKYTQALEKVNDLLTAHPENMEGRIWKKKIRAAQERGATYAEIARRIGEPKAARAVAQACAANQIAVAIPCHRVVRTDGSVSGYRWGVERKKRLLNVERAGG
jgi:serine/threonine-protein kinase